MPRRSEFVEYLVEMLRPLGEVSARSMFGGWGVYAGERFFAIVAGETLYLKADDVNREEFTGRGLAPFRYERNGRMAEVDYFQAPPEALDDRELLCAWAQKGLAASERAAAKKKTKAKKTRS